MARYEVKTRKPLWAVLITFIVVILIAFVFISSLREQEWFSLIIKALAKSMPFGDKLVDLVCKTIERINGVAPKIIKGSQTPMNVNEFFKNLIKLLFSGAVLDLFKELCKILLGADKKGDGKAKIKYVVSTFLAVILSTIAATLVVGALEANLGKGWSFALEVLIFAGALAAAVILAFSKYSGLTGFAYVFLKLFLLNSLIILGNSFIIMLVLGALQEGVSFGWIMGSMSGALLILIILIGMSLAVDSVFPSSKTTVRRID